MIAFYLKDQQFVGEKNDNIIEINAILSIINSLMHLLNIFTCK